MKCLDQNGVKHLWNCIFNNAVSKLDVDTSTNISSLNPISNHAVCEYVGSIDYRLSHSKADYEEGTWTPVVYKGIMGEDITDECFVGGSYYFCINGWVYITTSIAAGTGIITGSVSGLPFKIQGRYTPEFTSGFIITGNDVDEVMACKLMDSKNTMINFEGNKSLRNFTLRGWAKIVP